MKRRGKSPPPGGQPSGHEKPHVVQDRTGNARRLAGFASADRFRVLVAPRFGGAFRLGGTREMTVTPFLRIRRTEFGLSPPAALCPPKKISLSPAESTNHLFRTKRGRPPCVWYTRGAVKLATSYFRTTYRSTIIGAAAFHFRVRNGNGWGHCARVTRGLSTTRSTTLQTRLLKFSSNHQLFLNKEQRTNN